MDNVRIPWNGWKLVRYIGKGSYGTVYEIERTVGTTTEKAAMKVIPIPPTQQLVKEYRSEGYTDEAISNFCESMLNDTVNEYTMMRSMKENVNIVSCDDIAYLEKEDSVGWNVYIRMELLTPFFSVSKDRFDEKEIIKLGKDICNALTVCEAKNVVHRDIKPGNIFISDKGEYKLGDFGVARTMDHTTSATRVGTDKFMAPEVVKKEKYGNNVDLYSLGLVLYWLLNERRIPFLTPGKEKTPVEEKKADYKRLAGETLPAPKHGSQQLKELVLKACSYDRKDRFQSAQEMMDALDVAEQYVGNDVVAPRKRERIINDKTQGHSWGFTTNSGTFDAASQQTGTTSVSPTEATKHTMRHEETSEDNPIPKPVTGFGDKIKDNKKVLIGIGAALLVVAVAIVGVILGMNVDRNSGSSADVKNTTVVHSKAGWLLNDSEEETVTEEDNGSDDSNNSGNNSSSNNAASGSGFKLPGFLANLTSKQKDSGSKDNTKSNKTTTSTNKKKKNTTPTTSNTQSTTRSTTTTTQSEQLITVTVPGALHNLGEEVARHVGMKYVYNSDNSVTCYMTKEQQAQALSELKRGIDKLIADCKSRNPAVKSITYNYNFRIYKAIVDFAPGAVDNDTSMTFSQLIADGAVYQIFNGVPKLSVDVSLDLYDSDGTLLKKFSLSEIGPEFYN